MRSWRFAVGHKGVSRVTVYERPDATSLFVEWWDDLGRHRQALSDVVGHPVTEREVAEEIARRMSAAQERKRNQQAAELLGLPSPRSLKDLLERRHADLTSEWTPKYAASRERVRAFWMAKLGDVRLTAVTAATVERIAREAQGERSDRWRQDVLRYLVDSFIYAERKLKWIEGRHNLSAVKVPTARGESLTYTLGEWRAILPALWVVDPVAGWCGVVVTQAGRRIGAVRQLRAEDVTREPPWTYLRFPGATDKARNTGTAAVLDLPERTDWRVPSSERANDWLRAAEEVAEVPHVRGRGWHAAKRLYATLTEGLEGADLQSGTRKETLRGHYRQDVMGPKQEVARVLAGRLAGR
ncbi:MAG: hypothetical protein ABL993_02420 [Vicinamibacterales bacterium]